MIRTVLFDIDGTLYDYHTANASAMKALSAYVCAKLQWDKEQFDQAHRLVYDAQMAYAKGTAACHSRLIRYALFAEKYGLSQADAIYMDEFYWTEFLKDIVPFPYLRETLDSLKKSGIRIGAGTNMTAYVQYVKLKKLGLLDYFDFVMSSEEALAEKPDQAFFRKCLEKAGCAPKECLFIGDEMEKDVKGAESIGMHALQYCAFRREEGVLESYADLIEIIRKINAE